MLSEDNYNILRLIRSKNVGPHTFFKVIKFFGGLKETIENIEKYNIKTKYKNKIELAPKEQIEEEIVACSTVGAKIITYKNNNYPKILLSISDFPPVITAIGNIELFKKPSVSIVGSRNASSNGCNFARKIAKELGEKGYIITSGLATGIDTSSHKAALETGTIAVLGGGIDNIYPRGNEDLYYQIKNKGLLVSEVPFGSAPKAENFPARNRIISGLSKGVVIIEAGERSGTIHTARQAIEQNRELFVAPGNPYDYRCEGSNKLIKDGANVITCTEDISDILENFIVNENYDQKLILNDSFKNKFNTESNDLYEDFDNSIKNNKDEKTIFTEELIENNNLTIKEQIILKINHTPVSIDLLENDLNLSAEEINSNLIELELEDKIIIDHGDVRIK